jgi:hypothetical protein
MVVKKPRAVPEDQYRALVALLLIGASDKWGVYWLPLTWLRRVPGLPYHGLWQRLRDAGLILCRRRHDDETGQPAALWEVVLSEAGEEVARRSTSGYRARITEAILTMRRSKGDGLPPFAVRSLIKMRENGAVPKVKGTADGMRVAEVAAFVIERHKIHLRRQAGLPKPWTECPILQRWRFTNVYRELDTVTKWIAKNWREPHADDPYVFFAMTVARLVNHPESMAEIGYPVPWNPDHFVRVLEDRQRRKQKVFTSAYMIHADRHFKGSKAAYLAAKVFTPLWEDRHAVRRGLRGTLAQAHATLTQYRDLGSFMAAQVIADLKYVSPLREASDWWTWAASGPGSRRGLNRVLGRPTNAPWDEKEWLRNLQALRRVINPMLAEAGMRPIHAQDTQGICCCEWDKFERFRLREGKPKSRYPGLP